MVDDVGMQARPSLVDEHNPEFQDFLNPSQMPRQLFGIAKMLALNDHAVSIIVRLETCN